MIFRSKFQICQDSDSYKRFHAAVLPSKDIMIAEGFSSFAVEDFYDSFMEQLEKLDPEKGSNISGASTESNGNSSNGALSEQKNGILDSKLGKKSKKLIQIEIFVSYRVNKVSETLYLRIIE